MTKREFERRIDLARDELQSKALWKKMGYDEYPGVCEALQVNVSCWSKYAFQEIYGRPSGNYWFGKTSKYNVPKRLLALELYRVICLDEKLYKEF